MKSRIKRHILALLLMPLFLGACAPEPGAVRGLETEQVAVYLGGNVYRTIDPLNGVTCYAVASGGIRCFTPAELSD